MIRWINRSVEHVPSEGLPVRLRYAVTGVQLATRFGGLGASYVRPTVVTGFGARVQIRDHVMAARLIVALLVVIAVFAGRLR